jgi:hypothetical protein
VVIVAWRLFLGVGFAVGVVGLLCVRKLHLSQKVGYQVTAALIKVVRR